MTKGQYLELVKASKDLISQEKENIKNYDRDYISKNKRFDIGDKVIVFSPARNSGFGMMKEINKICYVYGVEIGCGGDLKYLLKKQKKDGSMSQINDYYSFSDTLTLA